MFASWNVLTMALNSETASPGFSANAYSLCGARNPKLLYPQ